MTAGGVYASHRDLPGLGDRAPLEPNCDCIERDCDGTAAQAAATAAENPSRTEYALVIANRRGYLTGLSDYLRSLIDLY